jgi:signal transduction histidine kinase/putative methionine-R-sulfoxide reductase with GAF domain
MPAPARGVPHSAARLPGWLAPLSAARGPTSLIVTGGCVFVLTLVYLLDLGRLGGGWGTAAILPVVPVLAASWLLSGRLSVLVVALAIVLQFVAGLATTGHGLEVVTDAFSLGLVGATARLGAVYVAATREAAARASLLARIAGLATSAESMRQVLDGILAEMAGEGLRGGLIALINEHDELYPVAAEGDIDQAVWNSRIPVGKGIMGTAAATGRSILVADIDAPEPAVRPMNRELGSNSRMKSLVVVPLRAAGRVIGVVEIDSAVPNRFGEADLVLLEQIALAVSDAVQREGALQLADQKAARRVEELSLLLDAARTLASSLEPELVQSALVRTVARAVGAEGGRAAFIRIEDGRLVAISDHDGEAVRTREIDFPLAFAPAEMLRAIETGHAVGCGRAQLDPQLAAVFGPSAQSFAWAPVKIGGTLHGVVSATSESTLFEWPALRMLEGVADLAGLAVGNAERLRLELDRTSDLEAHAGRMAELEKVKADFLKVASHELRGPLAVVKGYFSMLSDGSLPVGTPTTGKILEVIGGKLDEVSELVEQMLETARLEDSRLHLRLQVVDLDAVVAEAAERVRPAAPTHRLVVGEATSPVQVLADRHRLLTILTNLLDNAVKYSPDGGRVEVKVIAAGNTVQVRVRDHGLGIAEEDLPRLFTRFGRIVTAENSHIPGTGLGLYLARELARLHGGDITVRSGEGGGSTFTVSLPTAGARAHQVADA